MRSLFCRNFKDECLIVGRHPLVQQQLKAGPSGEIMNPLEISGYHFVRRVLLAIGQSPRWRNCEIPLVFERAIKREHSICG